MVLDVHARARIRVPRQPVEHEVDSCHEAPDVQGAAVVSQASGELEVSDEEESDCFP